MFPEDQCSQGDVQVLPKKISRMSEASQTSILLKCWLEEHELSVENLRKEEYRSGKLFKLQAAILQRKEKADEPRARQFFEAQIKMLQSQLYFNRDNEIPFMLGRTTRWGDNLLKKSSEETTSLKKQILSNSWHLDVVIRLLVIPSLSPAKTERKYSHLIDFFDLFTNEFFYYF